MDGWVFLVDEDWKIVRPVPRLVDPPPIAVFKLVTRRGDSIRVDDVVKFCLPPLPCERVRPAQQKDREMQSPESCYLGIHLVPSVRPHYLGGPTDRLLEITGCGIESLYLPLSMLVSAAKRFDGALVPIQWKYWGQSGARFVSRVSEIGRAHV